MTRQIITTDKAPKAIGTYSQAVRAGDTVYVSGQIPLDPATGELVGGDMEAQIRRVFENLQAIVEAAGATFANVVKLNVYLVDLKTMAQYFREPFPARAAIGVASLPRGAQIEMECVLHVG